MGAAVEPDADKQPMRFRQSAALLRELTERAAVATFLVGTNGELFYSNQACCDLLGYEPHETSGLALTDIIHPDHLATTRQQLSGLNRGEAEDYRAERQYLRKNGDAIWVDVRAAILRHERSGRPLYVIVQAIDIDRRKKAEAALAEAESRWNFALEGAGQGVWDHDLRNKRAFFSRTWKLMRGLDPDAPVDPAAAAWLDKVHPDDRDRIRDTIRRQDAGEIPHNAFEYRERHRDGHWIWILSRGRPVEWFPDGSVARTIGTDTDITGLKTVEAALAEEKERLRVTLESIGDGVISTDALGRITFINPVAEQMTGWPSGEAMGKPVAEVFAIVDEATDAPVTNPVAECLAHRRSFQLPGNAVLVGRSGERRDVSDSAAPLKTADGRIMGAVLVFQDVTSSRAFQKELAHSATHDPLTGLPNRVAFEQALLGACEQTGGETREHALCFLDLDRFKKVNDTAGHAAGDKLLQEIAEVIRRGCRSHDLAARIGGDEFALILRDCPLPAAEKVVRQIVDAIATVRFIWNGRTYEVGASVGITAIKPDSPLPSVLMREADDACYAAKAMGRNQLSIHGASAAGDQPARASA